MQMNIIWGKVKERLFLQMDAAGSRLKGLICRWLSRDLDDAGTCFAISLWESAELLRQYRIGVRELHENQFKALFVNEYSEYECKVRVVSAGALGCLEPSSRPDHTPVQASNGAAGGRGP